MSIHLRAISDNEKLSGKVNFPSFSDYSIDAYIKKYGGKKVKNKFVYNSLENNDYLSVQQIKTLIKNHKN